MRVAILESIIMPAGHEVEFDRILVNELKDMSRYLWYRRTFPLRWITGRKSFILKAEKWLLMPEHLNGRNLF